MIYMTGTELAVKLNAKKYNTCEFKLIPVTYNIAFSHRIQVLFLSTSLIAVPLR